MPRLRIARPASARPPQLFSCSVDKCIKVWDLRSPKCLQTIHDKTPYRPEDKISAMTFDPIHSRLLTGTTKLRSWPLVKMAKRSVKPGHEHPLCAALTPAVVGGEEHGGGESAAVTAPRAPPARSASHSTRL